MADIAFYFISGKLRHKGVSIVLGSYSLSEAFQDIALHLPLFNLDLLFDLHFKMVVNKIGILPDFMSLIV